LYGKPQDASEAGDVKEVARLLEQNGADVDEGMVGSGVQWR
jgi:hypothetical protein